MFIQVASFDLYIVYSVYGVIIGKPVQRIT